MDPYSFFSEDRSEARSLLSAQPYHDEGTESLGTVENPHEPTEPGIRPDPMPAAKPRKMEPIEEFFTSATPTVEPVEEISEPVVDSNPGSEDTEGEDNEGSESVDDGVEPAPQVDELQRAYHAAQQELERERHNARQRDAQIAHLTAQLQAPKAAPFDELPEEEQQSIIAEAERFGVTVEQVAYDRAKRAEAQFEQREAQFNQAQGALVDYITKHPKRSALGARVSQMLESEDSPFAYIDQLRLVITPQQYFEQSVKEVERCFAIAELEARAAKAPAAGKPAQPSATVSKTKQALKAATRGEMSRAGSNATPSNPNPGKEEDPLAAMMRVAEQNRRLTGLYS